MSLAPPRDYHKTSGIHRSGLAAARPAAGDVLSGTLYFSTDTGALQRSDGQAWSSYAGTVPSQIVASQVIGRGSDNGTGAAEPISLTNSFLMLGTQLTVRSGVFNYTYNSSLTEPPSAGQARLDAAYPWTAATKLWLRFVSADGQDLYWGIMIIGKGSTVLVQDKDDHTRYLRLTTAGDPIDKGLYAELPVTWQANGVSIQTAQQIFIRVAGTILSPSVQPQLDALAARVQALEDHRGQ
jgi:hypothetical protein